MSPQLANERYRPRKELEPFQVPRHRPEEAIDLVRQLDRIQISHPLPADYLEALRKASRQFPEKELHVYDQAFSGSLEGLVGFEHVQNLVIDLYGATSFDVLAGFTELRRLGIGATRSTKPSLAFLENCTKLEEVWLQGAGKGLEAVASLHRLELLRLQNLRAKSLDFLAENSSIRRMEILYASVRDLSPLTSMSRLMRLWVCRIRGLVEADLSPLAGKPLDMLALNDAPHVEDLDALGVAEVEHLSLNNLPSLRTLSSLRHWPKLKILGLREAHPKDGSLGELALNPSLRHLAIANRLHHDELRLIQQNFNGDSLWYLGDYIWGVDHPRDIIADRDDL